MAKPRFTAPRGTFDVLPWDEADRNSAGRLFLWRNAGESLRRAGYGYFESPIFEETALFARGVGATTDIVQKEMFSFEDKGGRELTLRPEGTASICRAYIEHGMHKRPQPVKLWYVGPFFRHERAQTGRYRQFSQIGAEALGSDDPVIDAELIILLARLLKTARVPAKHLRLRISSLGQPETRGEYLEDLRRYLRSRQTRLSPEAQHRFQLNPLRAFDSDDEETQRVMQEAPRLRDYLAQDDRRHLNEVLALLKESNVEWSRDDSLVRGLDYYTRTVFEFESLGPKMGSQRGIAGGGRYDRLIAELGGQPTPGVGWAAGIERVLLASTGEWSTRRSVTCVVSEDAERSGEALATAQFLRDKHRTVELAPLGRSLNRYYKHADRIGARFLVVVRSDLELIDLRRDRRETLRDREAVLARLRAWSEN